jgi:hypothetical protein
MHWWKACCQGVLCHSHFTFLLVYASFKLCAKSKACILTQITGTTTAKTVSFIASGYSVCVGSLVAIVYFATGLPVFRMIKQVSRNGRLVRKITIQLFGSSSFASRHLTIQFQAFLLLADCLSLSRALLSATATILQSTCGAISSCKLRNLSVDIQARTSSV